MGDDAKVETGPFSPLMLMRYESVRLEKNLEETQDGSPEVQGALASLEVLTRMGGPQGRGHRGYAGSEAKAVTYLVSIKTASNHIAPSKHIHTNIHVHQAPPSVRHHPLQVVLPPVIVGKEAIAGVKEDPERWQRTVRPGSAEGACTCHQPPRRSWSHITHGLGLPCLPHPALWVPITPVPSYPPAHTGCPVTWPARLLSRSPWCSPVLFIEFILPLELPTPQHAVIPDHQTSWDLLVELCGQVLEKQRCVLHSSWLQERKGDRTFARLAKSVMKNDPVWKKKEAKRPTPPKMPMSKSHQGGPSHPCQTEKNTAQNSGKTKGKGTGWWPQKSYPSPKRRYGESHGKESTAKGGHDSGESASVLTGM